MMLRNLLRCIFIKHLIGNTKKNILIMCIYNTVRKNHDRCCVNAFDPVEMPSDSL